MMGPEELEMQQETALKSSLSILTPEKAPAFVSVVLPCLNEERTIGETIREIKHAFSSSEFPYEIVVADNGSIDRSRMIAHSHSVRIVDVKTRGYGAALRAGIEAGIGDVVLFGDSDLTYDFSQGPALIRKLLSSKSEMAIGSRMEGTIRQGAMPPLHRYVGTPALTWLINLLFKARITDCNSGFRAFYKKSFKRWQIRSSGMEMASELIVNCLKSGGTISEMGIVLRKDKRKGKSHLHTWRDGMRHLLFILSRAPHGFTAIGFSTLVASLLVAIPSIFKGPTIIGGIGLFDYHSLILATLAGLLGSQSISYGLMMDLKSKKPLWINQKLLNLNEIFLLKMLALMCAMIGLFVLLIFYFWYQQGFNNINYLHAGLSALYTTAVLGSLGFGIFMVQIQKRI